MLYSNTVQPSKYINERPLTDWVLCKTFHYVMTLNLDLNFQMTLTLILSIILYVANLNQEIYI